ncbi:MAG: hypothetical protein RBU45_25020 [Myxococcota bacterium]|nr:hypothetical protein [Myxococcota bacterium]
MSRPANPLRLLLPLPLLLSLPAGSAFADNSNWEVGGKLYNKFLYTNDDSEGCLVYGNPFWSETITGGNGVCSEFEVNIKGNVSRWVEAGVRVKSRFHTNWHDWWESGNQNWLEDGIPIHNTSGDSQGMDHAEYMKLRGYFIRIAAPIPTVRWIQIGSTDFSQFNAWTIGKSRYIDRDNGKGLFFEGSLLEHEDLGERLQYNVGAVALPKLFVGPGWSTGLGDSMVDNPFLTQDWAYAAKLRFQMFENVSLTLVGDFTNDLEIDQTDPDATGTYYPTCTDALGNAIDGCAKDGGVDMDSRYQSLNVTGELVWDATDLLQVKGLLGYSQQWINPAHMANGARDNAGVSPVVFADTRDLAAVLDVNWDDPFEVGLSFKFEGFYIGPEWNSIFGARRETDVLLTDGFHEGGQLPTLNIANEFQDWDEPWFESIIGWRGLTGVLVYDAGAWGLEAEATLVDYGTNGQNWATAPQTIYGQMMTPIYPNFLHTDGYTDTDLYDYANVGDRGRDLRSVFKENQDRMTGIFVLKGNYTADIGTGLEFKGKLKTILDRDKRDEKSPKTVTVDGKEVRLYEPSAADTELLPEAVIANDLVEEWYAADDYAGNIYQVRGELGYQLTDWLRLFGGYQFDYWDEQHRSGTRVIATRADGTPGVSGVGEYTTTKHRPFLGVGFAFGGATLRYEMQYLAKDQEREFDTEQEWRVWRSKAALEVAW